MVGSLLSYPKGHSLFLESKHSECNSADTSILGGNASLISIPLTFKASQELDIDIILEISKASKN